MNSATVIAVFCAVVVAIVLTGLDYGAHGAFNHREVPYRHHNR